MVETFPKQRYLYAENLLFELKSRIQQFCVNFQARINISPFLRILTIYSWQNENVKQWVLLFLY